MSPITGHNFNEERMKDLTKLTESQLRYELETIQSQMEQDEWPLAKQKKLRDEQDRIAAEIRRRW